MTTTDPNTPILPSAIEHIPTGDLVPYARNSRTHSPEQVAQLGRSMREFGFTNPVLIDEHNTLIAGHGRVMAAQSIGLAVVPAIRLTHLSDAQRRAYVIADNKLAEQAGWDMATLAREVEDLQALDFDVDLLGFGGDELAALLGEHGQENEDQDSNSAADADAVLPMPKMAVTVQGDTWILGKHKLLCGDCRDSANISKLMGGLKINVAVTSPPYAEQREYDAASGFRPIPPDEYVNWYANVAKNIADNLAPDGSYFCNIKPAAAGLDTSLYVFDLVIAHVRQWGWHFATEFCWERNGIPKKVTRRFKNQFEPVYQFAMADWKMRPETVRHESNSVPKARGKGAGATTWAKHQGGESINMSAHQGEPGFSWFGDNIEAGLAFPGNRLPTFASSHESLGHAAAFPVGLPEFFIKAYSDKNDVVFDPFMGSGSTLMAAEKNSRVARGTELSPIYADIIVSRWQTYTGQQAVHEATGKTFAQLQAERLPASAHALPIA